jgi:hypothetical protein
MEPQRSREQIHLTRRASLAVFVLAALAPLGCLSKQPLISKKENSQPPPIVPMDGRLITEWDNKIAYGADMSRGGAPMPVLLGRLFLFGQDMAHPYIGDGSMIIDLYDATPSRVGPDGEPKQIEMMIVDPDTLKRFAKKDLIGDGYSILFPWYTYRQDISHVYIVARYTSKEGKSLIHTSGTFSIDHNETKERLKKGMSVSHPAMRAAAEIPGAKSKLPVADQKTAAADQAVPAANIIAPE